MRRHLRSHSLVTCLSSFGTIANRIVILSDPIKYISIKDTAIVFFLILITIIICTITNVSVFHYLWLALHLGLNSNCENVG